MAVNAFHLVAAEDRLSRGHTAVAPEYRARGARGGYVSSAAGPGRSRRSQVDRPRPRFAPARYGPTRRQLLVQDQGPEEVHDLAGVGVEQLDRSELHSKQQRLEVGDLLFRRVRRQLEAQVTAAFLI